MDRVADLYGTISMFQFMLKLSWVKCPYLGVIFGFAMLHPGDTPYAVPLPRILDFVDVYGNDNLPGQLLNCWCDNYRLRESPRDFIHGSYGLRLDCDKWAISTNTNIAHGLFSRHAKLYPLCSKDSIRSWLFPQPSRRSVEYAFYSHRLLDACTPADSMARPPASTNTTVRSRTANCETQRAPTPPGNTAVRSGPQ